MLGRGTGDRIAQRAKDGLAVAAWWMIWRSGAGGSKAMTLPCCGREALALFSHEEEAQLFLWSLGAEVSGGGWRIRESRCGEVASVLYGPCANVLRVALDPPPVVLAGWTVALASMDRGDFLAHLLARKNAAGTRRRLRPAYLVQGGSARRRTMRREEHRPRWVARGGRDL